MNLNPLTFFRPKPIPHKELRYVYPTKREATEAQRKEANRRASINCQLAIYNVTTTPAQRKAEADAFHEQFMREWPKLRGTK